MEKGPARRSNKKTWITLIVLPWVMLILVALLQIIVHFATSNSVGSGTNGVTTLANVMSIILGVVAVILILCLPIWIVMLVKNKNPTGPKSKTTAVVLAVLFAFWTWLYTYERDGWKFWLNFILTVVSFGLWGLVAWIWAIIETATRPHEYYLNFYQELPKPNSATTRNA